MNPFDTIAAGYAQHRPPVHPEILRRALANCPTPIRRAVDIGCGSGISTRSLAGIAPERVGVEPAASMVAIANQVDPAARFLVGEAESVPLPDGCADLVTAAGALNYVDLSRFFPEAARLLATGGQLLVYDFSTGNRRGSDWLTRFVGRYPWAPNEARHLDPAILAVEAIGFTLQASEAFAISLPLTRTFYVEYMLTEMNVAYAIRGGATLEEVRVWIESTLWADSEGEIIFPGYYALFTLSVK